MQTTLCNQYTKECRPEIEENNYLPLVKSLCMSSTKRRPCQDNVYIVPGLS